MRLRSFSAQRVLGWASSGVLVLKAVWGPGEHIRAVTARVDLPSRASWTRGGVRCTRCLVGNSHPIPPTSEPPRGAFVMTSPDLLQQLRRLDRSSSRFHDQLSNVFYGEEYRRCVGDLQGDGLVWVVDYLDNVRCRVAPSLTPLKVSIGSLSSRSFQLRFPEMFART